MARALLRLLALGSMLLAGSCLSEQDPCDGVTCAADRLCVALQRGTICACADPAVEVDGECVVEESGEGEGE